MSKNTTTLITVGYNTKLVVPIGSVSAVLALLRDCPLVTSEWTGDESLLVRSTNRVEVVMGEFSVLTREEYDALREAQRVEREAARLAAESGVEAA